MNINNKTKPACAPEDHVTVLPEHGNYHIMPADGYEGLATGPPAQNDLSQEITEDEPYHDLSEAITEAPEKVELEFDPSLRHYAELKGGLPIGHVWLPPSSPKPMPREATPEQDVASTTWLRPVRPLTITTEHKRFDTFALSPMKKRKRATTIEYQARFTSPLLEVLSDASEGLLTPEPREFILRR